VLLVHVIVKAQDITQSLQFHQILGGIKDSSNFQLGDNKATFQLSQVQELISTKILVFVKSISDSNKFNSVSLIALKSFQDSITQVVVLYV